MKPSIQFCFIAQGVRTHTKEAKAILESAAERLRASAGYQIDTNWTDAGVLWLSIQRDVNHFDPNRHIELWRQLSIQPTCICLKFSGPGVKPKTYAYAFYDGDPSCAVHCKNHAVMFWSYDIEQKISAGFIQDFFEIARTFCNGFLKTITVWPQSDRVEIELQKAINSVC